MTDERGLVWFRDSKDELSNKSANFTDRRANFFSAEKCAEPTCRIFEVDMSGLEVDSEMWRQLNIKEIREIREHNKVNWPFNKTPPRWTQLTEEATKKWFTDWKTHRHSTYGPCDFLNYVDFQLITEIFEVFREHFADGGGLADQLKDWDLRVHIFSSYDNTVWDCPGFCNWPPPKICELLCHCNGWSCEQMGVPNTTGAVNIFKSFHAFAEHEFVSTLVRKWQGGLWTKSG